MSLSTFKGIRKYDTSPLVKTPLGYMELLGSATFNGLNILHVKDLISGKMRFFSVLELSTDGIAKSPRFITAAVLMACGTAILVTGLITSFHSQEVVETVQVTAGSGDFSGVAGQLAGLMSGPIAKAGATIGIVLAGVIVALTGDPKKAFPAIIGGAGLFFTGPLVKSLGFADGGQTSTQTVKRMATKFSPGALSASLSLAGLSVAGFFGYTLYCTYRRFMDIKAVTIPGCSTVFDLFTMKEIPQSEMHPEHLLKFRVFDGTEPTVSKAPGGGEQSHADTLSTVPPPPTSTNNTTAQQTHGSDDGFGTSVIIGAVTGDPLLAGLAGGNFVGGMLGSALHQSDDGPHKEHHDVPSNDVADLDCGGTSWTDTSVDVCSDFGGND